MWCEFVLELISLPLCVCLFLKKIRVIRGVGRNKYLGGLGCNINILNIILKSIGYKIINFHISSYTWTSWEFNRNSKPVRNKKIEKTKRQKKNNHTHKTVFTWFGNLPTSTELQVFHYYNKKLQCAVTVFFFLKKRKKEDKALITNKKGFYILRTGFTMSYKTGQNFFCRPKPPLHGLSLSKSSIIRVINWIKSCLTTIFPGIKFIHYHLYNEIPCNFLLYINYHIICQKRILYSIAKSCF